MTTAARCPVWAITPGMQVRIDRRSVTITAVGPVSAWPPAYALDYRTADGGHGVAVTGLDTYFPRPRGCTATPAAPAAGHGPWWALRWGTMANSPMAYPVVFRLRDHGAAQGKYTSPRWHVDAYRPDTVGPIPVGALPGLDTTEMMWRALPAESTARLTAIGLTRPLRRVAPGDRPAPNTPLQTGWWLQWHQPWETHDADPVPMLVYLRAPSADGVFPCVFAHAVEHRTFHTHMVYGHTLPELVRAITQAWNALRGEAIRVCAFGHLAQPEMHPASQPTPTL